MHRQVLTDVSMTVLHWCKTFEFTRSVLIAMTSHLMDAGYPSAHPFLDMTLTSVLCQNLGIRYILRDFCSILDLHAGDHSIAVCQSQPSQDMVFAGKVFLHLLRIVEHLKIVSSKAFEHVHFLSRSSWDYIRSDWNSEIYQVDFKEAGSSNFKKFNPTYTCNTLDFLVIEQDRLNVRLYANAARARGSNNL